MKAKDKTEPKKTTGLVRSGGPVPAVAKLATEIRDSIETARSHVSATANLPDMRRFFESFETCQTASSKLPGREILQTASAESCDRLSIDFRKHFRLGWSHYRLLLSQGDPPRRKFYFEQAAEQRWPVRELQRQIDRGLFERVALSRDTSRLVVQEKQAGPAEIIRYEDIFKDPYVLDFLGLKGAYSEKDLEAAIILRHGPHKMKVAEYLTRLPDKHLLEERLKIYSRLLQKGEA